MSLKTLPGQLPLETAVAKRADFMAEITYKDLAAGIVNTALVVTLFTTLAKVQGVELMHMELVEPFQDTTDVASLATGLTVGDAGSANRHLASTELNANGTSVPLAFGTGTKYVPTADTPVTATFTPTAAKNVANYNKGKVRLFFKIIDQRVIV